jgi:hypothetical protein
MPAGLLEEALPSAGFAQEAAPRFASSGLGRPSERVIEYDLADYSITRSLGHSIIRKLGPPKGAAQAFAKPPSSPFGASESW